MHRYMYKGPVAICGKSAGTIVLETVADTEAKAISNFKYQIRKKSNMENNAKVELLGKIKILY